MDKENLTLLGDVHLGKKFNTGVPKHRLGEREEMVWKDFENSVLNCKTKIHIQVGDLFDSFIVPPEVVLRAAEVYKQAPKGITYVVLRGNHDASRDTNKKSSFDIFCELVSECSNVKVVKDEPCTLGEYAFIPWHPFISSQEQSLDLKGKYEAVFGHFDLESFGGSDHNLLPYDELRTLTSTVVTGHIHTPSDSIRNGLRVVVTGSMQPYSHGEDPEGKLYVTVTIDEVLKVPEEFINKNVRLLVKPGDEVPELDCLSLILKNSETAEDTEEGDIEVEFEDFDMDRLFNVCLKDNNVTQEVSEKILAKFKELRNA